MSSPTQQPFCKPHPVPTTDDDETDDLKQRLRRASQAATSLHSAQGGGAGGSVAQGGAAGAGGRGGRRGSSGGCCPLLFERASTKWWSPQFDSKFLETQYWKSSLPRTTRKFQFGLSYLLGLCLMLAVYFPVTRTTHWPTFLGIVSA